MKKSIANTITVAILSVFIGLSSIAVAESGTSAASRDDQMVVTLPEIICTAEKAPAGFKISYREYLNRTMESIRENVERIQLLNIVEELKSVLASNTF